ncbi:MAG: winged helix-turn-helix transcriptional regulator [Burkholderiaceae bacterium]
MAIKRSYLDACAAAHALDLVGERWALLVVRELLLGPKRFTDLRKGLPTISPNVLTQRLNELEADGVVLRRRLPPPAASWVYELTDWGKELEPALLHLVRWGVRSPSFIRGGKVGPDSLMLSFKVMFDPGRAQGLALRIQLEFGDEVFHARVNDGQTHVARGEADRPDATIRCDTQTALRLAYGKADLDAAVKDGRLSYTGSLAAIAQFFGCFVLPAVAQAAGR